MKFSPMRCVRALVVSGAAVAGVAMMASCQSTATNDEASAISKVDYYHLKDTSTRVQSQDRMVTTEAKKYLHGAVTNEECRERLGHYYTVYWKTEDKSAPVTVSFDYRQAGKDTDVHTLTEEVAAHKGKGATKFQVTGKPYLENGRVLMWRATVSQNGEVIGTERSFLWN
ncbi:hypothetical protein [Sulfuriroseicoccus oceanibius]|uniref:Lipoprotein n=1 Tax=Sulfuriroseicoccus oceanibius TaxID=2707525 RepID=A0A6B3LDB1_9BACT|nr:hypothetical protein [Sulfuriroseicoccus oceanibius]QQL45087.1 hypothetical protein G3M56_000425 [Sulfuriroseicoccus oceanibius]